MESKVAVLGDADFVMPYSALGMDTFAVTADEESVADSAKKILSESYGLVVVAENIAPLAEELFAAASKRPAPCVVAVPFTTESTGFSTDSLGKLLKIATGIDILKNN